MYQTIKRTLDGPVRVTPNLQRYTIASTLIRPNTDRQTDTDKRQTNTQTDKHKDRQTDKQTDRQTNRQTNEQTQTKERRGGHRQIN